ncbi:MAG: glycosyltransferase [Bacteroidota bacterium]|nr:glycosyltransferase [Bacteroidota bacterium]
MNNITVLMAVYNDSKYLKSSVKNILNQTYKNFEFLIIDDGSEDKPEDVIYGFKDSRINYKKIPHCGLAGALNYGLSISSGDWIARIDADDLNSSNRLKTEIDFLKANPEYDVISSSSVYFKDPARILFSIKPPQEDDMIKKFLYLHNPVNHSSVIFNKKKILGGGGYNNKFKSYEDFELWFRMKEELKFKILPEVLVYTRLRKNSLSKTGSKKDIYGLLSGNALQKIKTSDSETEKNLWKNIVFWIEYFYGEKAEARNYFGGSISLKKSLAYINTFLPDKIFEETREYRLRQRLQSHFEGKKKFKQELLKLLN